MTKRAIAFLLILPAWGTIAVADDAADTEMKNDVLLRALVVFHFRICGAESGMVPVSAISPSILVEQIEVEKKQKAQDRTPILDAPIASENG